MDILAWWTHFKDEKVPYYRALFNYKLFNSTIIHYNTCKTKVYKNCIQNVYTLNKKNYTLPFPLCLFTLSTTQIADIKTNSEVEPADINGSGSPVGGIEPVTTAIFIAT